MTSTTTGERAVDLLLAECGRLAGEAFGARLRSLYLIGSLAHGGFAPEISDIAVALLLAAPLVESDGEQIAALAAYCAAAHPLYGRRLSLFWSTAEAFADTEAVAVPGRFLALDRLDLVDHGRLFNGEALRAGLAPPTRAAVLANARADLLRFVRDPARYGFLTGGAERDFADRKALARLCLFPARFLYTATTGRIASNELAAEYFRDRTSAPDREIVALGLALRRDAAREPTDAERAFLTEHLPPHYYRFLRDFLTILGAPPPAKEATMPMLLTALDEG